MTDQTDLEKVTERVRKLLALAEKNPNEAEAASAAAKAQELLVAYNLDMATVEQGGTSGKREDARQRGGMYLYERELWQAVAKLNFCMYFATRKRVIRRPERRNTDGFIVQWARHKWEFQHRIIGRTVNTAATRVMGEYLQQTIERLTRERLKGDAGDSINTQLFSSWAVAFREGVAARVIEKLRERRQHLVNEETRRTEEAEKAAKAAARKGVSTATALTIASVLKSEADANADFLYGEGYSAEQAAARARRAAAEEQADREYTAWAKANPEAAKAEEAKRVAASRKRWSSYRGTRETARERRAGSGGYYDGYDTGANVSIDPQVDEGRSTRKRIGGNS